MKDRKKDASDLIDKAQAMMKRGEFKGAAAVFRRALKVDVESYDAHYGLAFSCKSMLDFAEAEESFKAALALRPSSAEAHYSLGTMYFGLGKFSEAAAELVEAVDLDMKLHDAYYFLGEASGKLGDMEKAKDYFKRFSNLCPSSPHFTKVQQRLKEIERTEGSGASTRSPR
jgi:tetratricopeptide (TPR) repeat protein